MNSIVIGKRIPIGAAVGGLIAFLGELWNVTHPEAQLSVAAVTGLSTCLVAIIQIAVVNIYGVTQKEPPEGG